MTIYLIVGLPGAGKTMLAKRLEQDKRALRLTPDDWQMAIFDRDTPGQWRTAERQAHRLRIEGKLIEIGLRAARLGVEVVLDFGLWGRDERAALRWLGASMGLSVEVVYLPVTLADQRVRIAGRQASQTGQFDMSDAELQEWQVIFHVPDREELVGGVIPEAPSGWADWTHWASERWPSLPALSTLMATG